MKKNLKVLLIVFFSIVVLALILIATIWFQRDQIKQYAINQLNEQLTTPVSVKTIDISFFEQFPKVSVQLNDVSIQDPIRKQELLFSASKLFVAFNIYDLLAKNYQVKLIAADSGQCSIYINKKGKANYAIFKTSDQKSEDVFLKLTEVKLHNMFIHYLDETSQFECITQAADAKFSGDFKGKHESIEVSGDFYVQQIRSGSTTIIKDKAIVLETQLQIDQERNLYTFSKSRVNIGLLSLACSGSIGSQPKYTSFDIEFNAPSIKITELLDLLPGSLSKRVAEYKSSGSIYFNGSIKGKLSDKQKPTVKLQFGIENGVLTAEKGTISINHLACKGEFSTGKTGKLSDAYLILPVFKFNLGGGSFSGALDLKNFNNPLIDLSMQGAAPVSDIIGFTKSQWIQSGSGQLEMDLAIKGSLKQLSSTSGFLECKTSGSLQCTLSDIVFNDGKKTIKELNGTFRVSQKDLLIETFTAKVDQSDIKLTGTFKNLVPFLLSSKQQLEADIHYQSTNLNIENIVFPTTASSESATALSLPDHIFVNATIDVGQLSFHEFSAKKVKGTIYWKGKKIVAEGITGETFNGTVGLNGELENTQDGGFVVGSTIKFTQVNIDELFRQCNNFGQQDLTYQNIKGKMHGSIDLAGVWNSKLECDLNKLSALCNLTIKQGELVNYKPLEALSKYVKLEDLRNLKFADLSNQIEIRKGTITIPEMVVNNTALNLSVSGTHTFENYLDYHFKLKLGDLLAKKFKQRHSEFEEEEAEHGTNVFISMVGPYDKLVFSYDKKEARSQVKKDLQKEREESKKIWRKELGIEKDETIKEQKTESEELEFEAE